MTTPALPLEGAKKKPERRPRTDAVVKLKAADRSANFHARVYVPGKPRALYRSLRTKNTACAERAFPHVKAQILRDQTSSHPGTTHTQEPLPL